MKLPRGLKLVPPGYKGRRFYYVRGTLDGRAIELSTRTNEPDRALQVASQIAAARTTFYVPHLSRLVLSTAEILALKERVDCGIYFLLLAGEIQYIGQSHRVAARIKRHREERFVGFDDWRVLRCEIVDLDLAEALYVRHYGPRHNRGVNRQRTKNPSPACHKRRAFTSMFSGKSM